MSMAAVTARHLTKRYGHTVALDDLSFETDEGELYGIIGPDGAGKTTLLRILATLLTPDKGSAQMGTLDVIKDYKAIRRSIGYMPGRFALYQDMTVEENLRFFATLFGTTVEENYHLVADIYKQIEPFRKRRAGRLSGGMKQKLALSCALIHKPRVLLLDEPTTGVDPVSRHELWDMLGRLKREGITILVSTPYMDEASRCDRIALMQGGRFMDVDTPHGLTSRFPGHLWAVRTDGMRRLANDLHCYVGTVSAFSFGTAYHVTLVPDNDPDGLRRHLAERGHSDICIEKTQPTVEDYFMWLAQKTEDEK